MKYIDNLVCLCAFVLYSLKIAINLNVPGTMETMDITTELDIKNLIDKFYTKVLVDPTIGFIFTDVVLLSWEKHIPIMNAFWGSILLGTNTYHGNPMAKHIELDQKTKLTEVHFNKWLELWEATVYELFNGVKANEAVLRAKNIARLMQHKINPTDK